MRTEGFRRGLISISLIFVLVLSTAFIPTPVRVAAITIPPPQRWDALITATFLEGSDDAIFGVRPDATAGFDTAYDIPEPHAPPEPPYVRAYFYYPGQTLDNLHRSCLAPENLMEWPLRIEYADDIENITLTWSVENVLPDYAVLLFEDENLVADMRAVDNYTFQTASGDFDFTIRVAVAVAWQLIETWTGNVSTPAEWQLIKIWTGTIEAPAAWQLLETWTGTVEAPIAWQLVDTWIGTIQTPVPPAAPSLISPVDGTITNDNTPTFDWSDVTGAENYDLLVDDDADFSSPEIEVTVSASTYKPTAELPDDNYSWKVRARDAANNVGDWSRIWTLLISVARGVEVYPAADVYAFSGNETGYSRSQLKFDIRGIPFRSNILSAKLWLYRFAADNWDGEILLNRVDNQPWSENITASEFDAQPLTNEETRVGKFMAPDWDCLDVENQLSVDHEAGHAYSSYRLRWANDNGSEPSVGIDDGRFLVIESELGELSIIFSSSEYNGSDPYLEVVYFIPHGWYLIETWTSTVEAFAEWQIMEPLTGSISAPAEWNLIETWNGTVSAPAEWQLIEIWTGTVKVLPAWKLIETWNGTVSAPAEWQLIEIWTGTASVPVAAPPGKPSLISPANGTITSDKTPTFDWSDVTGAENYDLLVDRNPDFSSPEIQVTVFVSTYTPTAELPEGNYSWRVQARDAAGNVSDWSSTWTLLIKTIVRRVDASISPESKGGHPEETLTYTVTVVNEGDDEDTYDLTVTDALAWDPTVSPTSLTIAAGGSDTASVGVTIPEGTAAGTEDEITVTATSRTDLTVSDSATCIAITTAVRRVKVSILPENQSGAPEEMLTYEVTVKNEGNIGDTYILSVAGVTDWWPRVENTSLTLNAGGVGETTLTVTIPPGVTEGLSITVNVSAISVGDPRVVDSDTCRTIVKGVPAVPEWDFGLPLMISALLIGAVLLTPAYLLRARSKKAARRRVLRGPRVWS